jgi:glyoxylase-like metal-dependent hydrolase (beta-lactamase superfamily II)
MMNRRGHVEPHGAPLVQVLSASLTMIKISVGPMDNNAYLLQPREGAGVLIDAANDEQRLLEIFAGRPVATIVTTHRHGDHWQALALVAAKTGARLLAGAPDAEAIAADAGVEDMIGVWDGDLVAVGDLSLEVIGLVGHTPGSIALAYLPTSGPARLFTGDSLFPGGPGRTTNPQDFGSLMDDLEAKIFARFGNDAIVHPGHGDDTTIGVERPKLPIWRARGW